jgi:hypothetical protein
VRPTQPRPEGKSQRKQSQPKRKRKRKTGRKDRRLDPLVRKRLLDAIRAGNTFANAAILSGIGESTFFRWMVEGEAAKPKSRKWEFREQVKSAEAEAIHRNVLCTQTAARTDWKAARWFLERRKPYEWGPLERIEQSGPQGQPVQVAVTVSEKFSGLVEKIYGEPTPEPTPAT